MNKILAVVIGCLVLSGVTITGVMVAMYCLGSFVVEALRGPAPQPPGEFQ